MKKQVQERRWREAIDTEMQAHEVLGTFSEETVRLPEGRKPISLKWVFDAKYNAKGEFEKAKARLTARGFTQRAGIDFDEVSSSTVQLNNQKDYGMKS